jgi:hypothetical protein
LFVFIMLLFNFHAMNPITISFPINVTEKLPNCWPRNEFVASIESTRIQRFQPHEEPCWIVSCVALSALSTQLD